MSTPKKRPKRVQPPKITDIRADWLYPPEKCRPVREFTLVIPHRMPNLNDIIRMKGDRNGGTQWTRAKEAYERAVRLEWVLHAANNGHIAPIMDGPFTMTYALYVKDRRTDPSNLFAGAEKVILDALVSCGALPGDGFAFHRSSKFTADVANKWSVVVTAKRI